MKLMQKLRNTELKLRKLKDNTQGSILSFGIGIAVFLVVMFQLGPTILSAGATLLADANWSSFPGGSVGVTISILCFFLLGGLIIIKAMD